MKKYILALLSVLLLGSCAVKSPISNEYKLEAFSQKKLGNKPKVAILITQPEAVGGYQTRNMLYMKEPFQLNAFARNAWTSTPSNMLYPLILQSLKSSGLFYAVTSSPYGDKADYRLDTQLIALHQNFICKPSVIEFKVNIVLTHIPSNKVITSKIINQKVPCPFESPYGGVLAANIAAKEFTRILVDFLKQTI